MFIDFSNLCSIHLLHGASRVLPVCICSFVLNIIMNMRYSCCFKSSQSDLLYGSVLATVTTISDAPFTIYLHCVKVTLELSVDGYGSFAEVLLFVFINYNMSGDVLKSCVTLHILFHILSSWFDEAVQLLVSCDNRAMEMCVILNICKVSAANFSYHIYLRISRQFLSQFRRKSYGGRLVSGSCHTARVSMTAIGQRRSLCVCRTQRGPLVGH